MPLQQMPAYVISFKDFKISQLLNSEAYNDSRLLKRMSIPLDWNRLEKAIRNLFLVLDNIQYFFLNNVLATALLRLFQAKDID